PSRRLAMALPRTLGELQLYRVLQRANLLGYYETFIQQGGDDVQQLCEAGEEEFLEIMALVGMATKPLHVRRLQKALREWASNPGLFSQPVSAVPVSSIPLFKLSEAGGRKALSNGHASPGEAAGKGGSSAGTPPARSPTEPGEKLSPSAAPPWPGRSTPESEGGGDEELGGPPFSPGGSGGEQPVGAEVLEPELVRTVAESVERLLQSCPRGGEAELRALMKLNKKLAKAVGHIFQLEDGDRHKEEEIRRHSAIYGRGEARRREGKQLTLHEVGSAAMPGAAVAQGRDRGFGVVAMGLALCVWLWAPWGGRMRSLRGALHSPACSHQVGEQSRPELLPLPVGPEPPGAAYRASLEEDTGSLSGESLDGHLQAAGACPRLTPPPGVAPDVPLGLPPHGLWSRHILQQTLMDEGLRLARLVSHERVGRLSPLLPGKPP
ncbi:NAB2 protein, partial [Aegotheles bennettii]|nr:NAB2 protein [Aegotheles bennettii]